MIGRYHNNNNNKSKTKPDLTFLPTQYSVDTSQTMLVASSTTTNTLGDDDVQVVVYPPSYFKKKRSEVYFQRIQEEAKSALNQSKQKQEGTNEHTDEDDDYDEGLFDEMLYDTILSPDIQTFEEMVASVVSYRLTTGTTTSPSRAMVEERRGKDGLSHRSPSSRRNKFYRIILGELQSEEKNRNNNNNNNNVRVDFSSPRLCEAIMDDLHAVVDRDPACHTMLEVMLFYKGWSALVCHRVAHRRWLNSTSNISNNNNNESNGSNSNRNRNRRNNFVALMFQSLSSQHFQVDIHPGATIGSGVVLDHATGIVIGETATVGNNCTLLHNVTLGGTAKKHAHSSSLDPFDRHPKLGHNVMVGSGASILGNIRIGHNVKIGAGSIVLKPVPDGATAVGTPAKIILRRDTDSDSVDARTTKKPTQNSSTVDDDVPTRDGEHVNVNGGSTPNEKRTSIIEPSQSTPSLASLSTTSTSSSLSSSFSTKLNDNGSSVGSKSTPTSLSEPSLVLIPCMISCMISTIYTNIVASATSQRQHRNQHFQPATVRTC